MTISQEKLGTIKAHIKLNESGLSRRAAVLTAFELYYLEGFQGSIYYLTRD